jgi:hypothetical protein
MKRAAVVLVASILLVSCSGSDDVDWENYDPSVRIRIDSMAAAGDCAGLQEEFDIADANNDAQLARTGDNNADLMSYIDGKMSDAGCYGENLNLADPTPSNSPMEEPRTFYFIVPDVVGLPVQKAKDALRDALYNAQAQDNRSRCRTCSILRWCSGSARGKRGGPNAAQSYRCGIFPKVARGRLGRILPFPMMPNRGTVSAV